jgi:abequosyltransferase
MSDILLSICIPTYNRCDILDITLQRLFNSKEFDEKFIEVIVSDNCSTDNTRKIVSKYPLAKYYCNEKNLIGYNFNIVLSYAKGTYIRILNDTFIFKTNQLAKMIDRIKFNQNLNCALFFYPNTLSNVSTVKNITSINSFFLECSFNTTWTASTGFWRKDFEAIENKDKYTEYHFPQLHWMYEIVRKHQNTRVYFEDLYEVIQPSNKGGYNLFRTFVTDYLFIVKQQKLDFCTFEIEKYRLCRFFIFPWMRIIFSNQQKSFNYETKGVYKNLIKSYWYEPYFPFFLVYFIFQVKILNVYNNIQIK